VNHEVDVIQKHPLGLVVPLDVGRSNSGLSESLLYLIRDGLNLPRVATRADDEVIGERPGSFVHFQDGNVFGFLGLGGLYCVEYLSHGRICFLGH